MNMVITTDDKRVVYLAFIQRVIRDYQMTSEITRLVSLAVVAGMFVFRMLSPEAGVFALASIGAAVMLVVLWLFDAKQQQARVAYMRLYDEARGKETVDFDMDVDRFRSAARLQQAIWNAPAAWLYVAELVVIALLSMMKPI